MSHKGNEFLSQTQNYNPYICATRCRKSWIFQTLNTIRPKCLRLNYQRCKPSGFKEIVIRKFEFVPCLINFSKLFFLKKSRGLQIQKKTRDRSSMSWPRFKKFGSPLSGSTQIPLGGFSYPYKGFIIPLEGFRCPS